MDPKLITSLKMLGVAPEAAQWPEVQRRYRQLVHALHPDRHGGVSPDANAYVAITRAFQSVRHYHQRVGALPGDAIEYVEFEPPASDADEAPPSAPTSGAPVAERGLPPRSAAGARRAPSLSPGLRWVGAALVLASALSAATIGYAIWQRGQVPPVTPFTHPDGARPLTGAATAR